MLKNEKKGDYMYIATDTTKYEFEIAGADSLKELCKILSLNYQSICSSIAHKQQHHITKKYGPVKIIKIDLKEEA